MVYFFRAAMVLIALFSGVTLYSQNARSDSPKTPQGVPQPTSQSGPHGGKILESPQGTAEVKMDLNTSRIHVYLPKHPEKNPTGISVTLSDQNQKTFSIDLNRLEPTIPGKEEMIHYQGELNPAQTSFMGIQIKIPFSKGSPTILEERNLFQ